MNGANGHWQQSSKGIVIALIDALLIPGAVIGSVFVRFWGNMGYFSETENLILKMAVIVFAIQVVFYYLDLYDPRVLKEKTKMGFLILESLGASSILLAVVYYTSPSLAMGRGIFIISLCLIFLLTFLWRLAYVRVSNARVFKERVLIVGTGELAMKIKKEILENGHTGFEIIGFIDENREKIGKPV
jgi:FlaA1/EpsC-like NDP-sugar epimerase